MAHIALGRVKSKNSLSRAVKAVGLGIFATPLIHFCGHRCCYTAYLNIYAEKERVAVPFFNAGA